MPKQRRAAASRSIARPAAKKSSSNAPKALKLSKRAKVSKPSSKLKASKPSKSQKERLSAQRPAASLRSRRPEGAGPNGSGQPPAPAPPRRPAFYEALAVYETGVRALQRHDFQAAADSLRGVIQRYPGERELVERARLYLQVCERETARRPSGPQTPSESVYAATVALNAGDVEGALGHLNRALEQSAGQRPRSLYYGCCPSRQGRSRRAHWCISDTLSPSIQTIGLLHYKIRISARCTTSTRFARCSVDA